MSNAENLLDTLVDEPVTYTANSSTEPHIIIGEDRYISVPDELKRIAVQYDHNAETVIFDCPRYWDDHDMAVSGSITITYERSDGETGTYLADNVRVDENDSNMMHFDWCVSGHATAAKGKLIFQVCHRRVNVDVEEVLHWNSELNEEMYISEGFDCHVSESEYINKPEEIVNVRITTNGTHKFEPRDGFTMSRFIANVDVPTESGGSDAVTASVLDGSIETYTDENITSLRAYAFSGCLSLTEVNLPAVTEIGVGAFANDSNLTTVTLGDVLSIADNAFYWCEALESIDLSDTSYIGQAAFYGCTSLTEIVTGCITCKGNAFGSCTSLTKIEFTESVAFGTYISDTNFFQGCNALEAIIFSNTTGIATNAVGNFTLPNGTCYIYVPAALLDTYTSNALWSARVSADRFRAIEDYPDICG